MKMRKSKRSESIKILAELALLTATVVILQILGSFIHLGTFSVSLVLVPVVLGAALFNPYAGAWLGLVFGIAVLLSGDASAFFAVSPVGTVLTVLIKGTAAGFVSGVVFRLIRKTSALGGIYTAAFLCPIVNTGVFLLGCLAFFMPTLREWSGEAGYENVGSYIILYLVGGNFLFELLFNILLAPVIYRIIGIIKAKSGHL